MATTDEFERIESTMHPEMPPGLHLQRTTAEFSAQTVPSGLLAAHRVAASTWGRLRVSSGSVTFVFEDEPLLPRVLAAGDHIDIPPSRHHHVEPATDAVFVVEFYR